MLNNPKINVIMSVYNGEKYLGEAIESILNQSFTDYEFIIVNDGSTDNSLKIIQSYHDKRVCLINNETNIGLTKSLNKAIEQARGEYIARQDADDISLPNRLEEQMRYLIQYPETALLGTSIYIINEGGKVLGKKIASTNPRDSLLKSNQFNHGSTMFKSKVVRELGGYNELLLYCQDYDLWLRMAKHHEVKNLKQVLYKLRSHNENVQFKKRDKAALYHLLAQRLARNDLEAELLKVIKDSGIESLRPHLNKDEKVILGKAVAYMHLQHDEVKLAREEYWKVLKLKPISCKNWANLILSYLGRGIHTKADKIYQKFT